jgi:hemerythrin superfamily protein
MNMDVFSLLHEDHENVSLIFKKIESMRSKETEQTREQLFKELYTELTLHAEVEEDVVYPFFEEKQETASIVEESLREHEEIETLLSELKAMRPDDEEWMSTLSELKEKVEQHVQEEEGEFFPTARTLISEGQMQRLGETVETMKEELRGQRSGFKAAC